MALRLAVVGVAPPAPAPPPPPAASSPSARRPPLLHVRAATLRCRCRRAEQDPWTTARGRTRRRWWSDDLDEDDDDEEEEDYDGGVLGGAGEFFDEPWFSKVFRTFGYVLPVMLASMLLATGPKAFLMAMALPLAQSAIASLFAFASGRATQRQQQQERPYEYDPFQQQDDEADDDEEDYNNTGSFGRASRSRRQEWQRSSSYRPAPSSKPNYRGRRGGFGGWDELDDDDGGGGEQEGTRTKGWKADTTAAAEDGGMGLRRGGRRASHVSSRYKQAPLMTRLLVALFPFLGSWFRLL